MPCIIGFGNILFLVFNFTSTGNDTHNLRIHSLFVANYYYVGSERLLKTKDNFQHPLVCTRESNNNKNLLLNLQRKILFLVFVKNTVDVKNRYSSEIKHLIWHFEYILYLFNASCDFIQSIRCKARAKVFWRQKPSVDEPDIPEDFNETILFLA